MTKLFTTAICTGAALSTGMLIIATFLVGAGHTVAAGMCLLLAGAVLYGTGLAVAGIVAAEMLKGN